MDTNSKRIAIKFLYLVFIYGLLPGLFFVVDLTGMMEFFLPNRIDSVGVGLAVGGLHLSIAGALLIGKWQKYTVRIEST